MLIPKHIAQKLEERKAQHLLRSLDIKKFKHDFFSNDYLGFAQSNSIAEKAFQLASKEYNINGATGSRLISGNSILIEKTEKAIAHFHQAEAALLFSSGFLTNLGVLSSIPQLGETILYDELSHASIREGIRLSASKSYKFKHNNLEDLERLLKKNKTVCYIVVESVYSMDGDSPNKERLLNLCEKYNAFLIIDEAHALGVCGFDGKGLFSITDSPNILAIMYTYGKALGSHGGAVISKQEIKNYLINFSRPFIYTTAPSPHQVASIKLGYDKILNSARIEKLKDNIDFFKKEVLKNKLHRDVLPSDTAIQSLLIGNIKKAKFISEKLSKKGFGVKEILSPSVPSGKERIRISLHSFNKKADIASLAKEIKKNV